MKRNKDESYADYCIRRSAQNIDFKERAKGKVIWNSQEKGNYNKLTHGSIGDQHGH